MSAIPQHNACVLMKEYFEKYGLIANHNSGDKKFEWEVTADGHVFNVHCRTMSQRCSRVIVTNSGKQINPSEFFCNDTTLEDGKLTTNTAVITLPVPDMSNSNLQSLVNKIENVDFFGGVSATST